jgi:flagellar basal body-associated protein FliL
MAKDKEPAEGTKGKKKTLLIAVPVVVVSAAAGAFFLRGGSAEAVTPTTSTYAPVEGEVIEVDQLTVNLVGEEDRYARLGFALVLAEGVSSGEVGKRVPLLRDAAISVLTEFTTEELRTAEGMERLRARLSEESIALFEHGEVIRAVLTELIVQ